MSAVGAFVLTPLIYLGGVFFSIESLHPFWKTISLFNPMLYFINGVRYGLVGQADVEPMWAAFVSLGGLLFFYLLAIRVLKTGQYSRW